jgi:hypothetical protein
VSGDAFSRSAVAGPGFPRVALGLAWLCSSVAVGVLGRLLLADPDRRQTGWVVLALAVLGVTAASAVATNRRRALTLGYSMAVSAVFVAAGVVAAVLVATRADPAPTELLLLPVIAVAGGVVGGLLSRRARRMAR